MFNSRWIYKFINPPWFNYNYFIDNIQGIKLEMLIKYIIVLSVGKK